MSEVEMRFVDMGKLSVASDGNFYVTDAVDKGKYIIAISPLVKETRTVNTNVVDLIQVPMVPYRLKDNLLGSLSFVFALGISGGALTAGSGKKIVFVSSDIESVDQEYRVYIGLAAKLR